MIDLRNIAQQLRLPAEQLRIAADLLEQGYQPAFIARHRADEAGHLPGSVLWTLKFAIEREHQLAAARHEATSHLGEGVELDDEARERVERSRTIVDIDVAMRCFRARRAARQSGERSGQASQLLEKMIAAAAPVTELPTWAAEQLSVDAGQAETIVQQCSRLIGTLLGGDTRFMERLRQTIQKRAAVHIEALADSPPAKSGKPDGSIATRSAAIGNSGAGNSGAGSSGSSSSGEGNSTQTGTPIAGTDGPSAAGVDRESSSNDANGHDVGNEGLGHEDLDGDDPSGDASAEAWAAEDDLVGDHAEHSQGPDGHDEPEHEPEHDHERSGAEANAGEQASGEATSAPGDSSASQPQPAEGDATSAGPDAVATGTGASESVHTEKAEATLSLTFESRGKKSREGKSVSGKRKERTSAKSQAKLTPRQRRRRWLVSVLQPFKTLKKPLQRLTSYQMLMLGRGQRSQLIKVDLEYDRKPLVNMARDVFVSDQHPLAKWFTEACEQALTGGLLTKVEADALAEEDELAQQKLLESATDQLRTALLQRPIKGHRILVVDTVGPNSACVAIIDARGKCLATQEVVCSSQPTVVSQNLIMLGELVHKHRVTLVALSNGPARRFLVHTVAELMKQSASGNLRWTMVDRGGAEAYAASRQASVELPQLNRRFRAAVWLGRRLQDPLTELLKLDPSRLRLGSYQRELPQEPLKQLVAATLSDCLCVKGVDARFASEQQFSYVPGASPEVAKKLAEIAAKREFRSREELTQTISEWSETGKRQALGFLRIYESPQPLDGTLIHPDDYRLAQRLIENAALPQPPASPPGWVPPKVKQPRNNRGGSHSEKDADASNAGPAHSDSASPQPANGEPIESSTALGIEASQVGASSGADSSNDPSPAAVDSNSPANDVATSETSASETSASETSASEGAASETAGESVVSETGANETATDDSVSDPASSAESLHDEASEDPVTDVTAEYSEDVVAEQAAAPAIDVEKLARGWQVGRSKLAWLAQCLSNPFGDTRDSRPPAPMLTHVPTLADLKPGMSVYAIVVGVAEFGAFVELGPDCGGLVHISRLSARFVEDPHQAVQIGDLIQAWVVSVDAEKRRVALTALSPEQQAQQAEAQRAAEQSRNEGGGRSHRGSQSGGSHSGQQRSQGQSTNQSRSGAPAGQSRGTGGGRPGGAGRPSGGQGASGYGSGGQGSGGQGSGHGGGQRRERSGGPAGGRSRSGGRHGGSGNDAPSKPVVVKSKKPSKPITEAMQKGQEPLRSFSDLLQYYDMQRPDGPAPNTPPPNMIAKNPTPGEETEGNRPKPSEQAASNQAASNQAASNQAASEPRVSQPPANEQASTEPSGSQPSGGADAEPS